MIVTRTPITPRDQQGGWRDPRRIVSTAGAGVVTAHQTLRRTHAGRAKSPIQRVIAPEMVGNPPRCHTGRLEAEYAIVGDWQAFMRLGDSLTAQLS